MPITHIMVNDTAFGMEAKSIIKDGERFLAGLRNLQAKLDTMVVGDPANYSNVASQFGLDPLDTGDLTPGQTFYNLWAGAKAAMEASSAINELLNRCGQNFFVTP